MSGYTSSFSASFSSSTGYSSSSSYSTSYSSTSNRWVPAALGGSYTIESSYTPRAAEFMAEKATAVGGRSSARWYPMAMGK